MSVASIGPSSVPLQLLQTLSGGRNEATEPKGINDHDADDAPAAPPPPAPAGTGRVVDKQA